jgi:TolB-like protein/Tfp pilus assembly protein PilF
MAAEIKKEIQLEIAHVLFVDIVGYSRLLINEQRRLLEVLNEMVRGTEQFRAAEEKGRLITIPTGDGMALVFYHSPEAPVECALELSHADKKHPELQLRMGVHSGPVSGVIDVSGRANIAGAGINMAQRVMDCGDAGHILLSKRVAQDLEEYAHWQPHLHDLGECEGKHGVKLSITNLFGDDFGNATVPTKFAGAIARRKARRFQIGLAIAVVLLLAAGIVLFRLKSGANLPPIGSPVIAPKSIAVLPFESLSEDKANAYFADGIQEEILARLSKIADLKVISRTSTQKYRSAPTNLREIAQQLGVTNVLEGSVQKAADQVRIRVQLVNALNDSHLWTETYDRKMVDVFEVESDVAQKIVASLEAKLTGREKIDIAVVGTKNPEAYDAFLHALALRNKQGLEIMEKVIGFSRLAVELDPNYAEAWAMLGIGEAQKYFFPDHSDAQLTRARTAAENALRLAPDSADGHYAMGMYYYYCLGDYDRALADLNIAHERAPNNANILLAIGSGVRRRQGNIDESITTSQEAAKLDPLNEDVWVNLGRSYRGARRFDEARAMFDRALTITPGDLNLIGNKAETYLAEGDLDSAGRLLDSVDIAPNNIVAADQF